MEIKIENSKGKEQYSIEENVIKTNTYRQKIQEKMLKTDKRGVKRNLYEKRKNKKDLNVENVD